MSELDDLMSLLDSDEEESSQPDMLTPDSTPEEVQVWLINNGFDHIRHLFKNKTGKRLLDYTHGSLDRALGPLDGIDLYKALHPGSNPSDIPSSTAPPTVSNTTKTTSTPPQTMKQQDTIHTNKSSSPVHHVAAPSTPQPIAHAVNQPRPSRLAMSMTMPYTSKGMRPSSSKTSMSTASIKLKNASSSNNRGKDMDTRTATYKPKNDEFTEKYSGIRVKNRIISSIELSEKIQGLRLLPLSELPRHVDRELGIVGDYLIAGVVCKIVKPKESSTGKKYSIIHISDMKCTQVSIFLFGEAFQTLKRIEEGALVFIQNAKVVPKREDKVNFSNFRAQTQSGLALSINNSQQLLHVGTSMDLGYCQAFNTNKKTHKATFIKCNQVINKQHGDKCDFHAKQAYQKSFAQRMDLNKTRIKTDRLFGPTKTTNNLSFGSTYNVKGKSVAAVTTLPPSQDRTGSRNGGGLKNFTYQSKRMTETNKNEAARLEQERSSRLSATEKLQEMQDVIKSSHDTYEVSRSNIRKPQQDPSKLIPQLGKGWDMNGDNDKMLLLDDDVDISVKRMKSAQQRAVELLRRNKIILIKPDLNNMASKHVLSTQSSSSSSSNKSSSFLSRQQQHDTSKSIKRKTTGGLDLSSPDIQALINAKSKHEKDGEIEKMDRIKNNMKAMEEQEAMEERFRQQTSEKVNVFCCLVCKTMSQYIGPICKEKKHKIDKKQMTKRYFACGQCNYRTTVLKSLLPSSGCKKCGSRNWKPTSIVRLKSDSLAASQSEKSKLKLNPFELRHSLKN